MPAIGFVNITVIRNVASAIPDNILLNDDGTPILNDDGNYIYTS